MMAVRSTEPSGHMSLCQVRSQSLKHHSEHVGIVLPIEAETLHTLDLDLTE